jgi:6-phosphogluconolactonase
MIRSRWVALSFALALPLSAGAHAQEADFFRNNNSSYVYVMSNNATANSVAVLKRNFFGGLDKVEVVQTGGIGVGVGTTAPPPDPLGAQNELLLSQDGHWLFAVNAGSDQVSVFQVQRNRIDLVGVVPSGGTYPVSLAQHGDTLYVLNSAKRANIVGFHIGRSGDLTQIAGSTRYIGTNSPLIGNQPDVGSTPTELRFNGDGDWLAVTVKDAAAKGSIELFAVDRHGNLAQDPVTTPSGDTSPFGFTFDNDGHLLVAEAGGNAVSSYAVGRDGKLRSISTSVANGQAATCWLAANGRFAYTANAGSSTLSGYWVDSNGHLQLLEKNGIAANLGAGHAPTDIKISGDGHSLYVLNPGAGSISSFFVGDDGRLFFINETPLFPALSGMQGLALN